MYIILFLISNLQAYILLDEQKTKTNKWIQATNILPSLTQYATAPIECQPFYAGSIPGTTSTLTITNSINQGFNKIRIIFDIHFTNNQYPFILSDGTHDLIKEDIVFDKVTQVCLSGAANEFVRYYNINYPYPTTITTSLTLTFTYTKQFYIKNFNIYIEICTENCKKCQDGKCIECQSTFTLDFLNSCICNGVIDNNICYNTCPASSIYNKQTNKCDSYTSITQLYYDQYGQQYNFHPDYNTTIQAHNIYIDGIQVGGSFIQNEYISYDINYVISSPIDIIIQQTIYLLGELDIFTSINTMIDDYIVSSITYYFEIFIYSTTPNYITNCVAVGFSQCKKIIQTINLYQINTLNTIKIQGKFNVTNSKQAWAYSNLKIQQIIWPISTPCLNYIYNDECITECPKYSKIISSNICSDYLSQYLYSEYLVKIFYDIGTYYFNEQQIYNSGIKNVSIAQLYENKRYIYGGYSNWNEGELKLSLNCKPHYKARLYVKLLMIDFNTPSNITIYFDSLFKVFTLTDGTPLSYNYGDQTKNDYLVDINSNLFEINHDNNNLDIVINCNGNDNYAFCGLYDFFVLIALCPENCLKCSDQFTCLEVQETTQQTLTIYYNCQDGYYYKNGKCIECNAGCKQCTNNYQCLQCFDNYIQYGTKCYCQYSKANIGSCMNICHKTCQTCIKFNDDKIIKYDFRTNNRYYTMITCQTCNINEGRVMNIKHCECQEGYYQDEEFNCNKCDGRCKTCMFVATSCISCYNIQNRQLNIQTCNCKDNYYEVDDSYICMKCNDKCQTCLYNENYCTQCYNIQNRILNENMCICKIGYFDKDNQLICQKCNDLCEYCSDFNICTSCNDYQYRILLNQQCICQNGYYDNNQLICKQCYYTCTQCNQSNEFNQCLSCPNTRKRSNNLLNTFECLCKKGYYDNLEYECIDCSTYQYPPINHYCYSNCGDGIVQWNEDCDDSNQDSRDGCNQCYFSNSKCLNETCIKCFVGDCIKCIDGYYLGNDSTCYPCSQQCITCENSDTQCITCKFYSSTNQCILCNSDIGYTIILDQCISICGDGIKTQEELCDDSNIIDGDGCSQFCTVEDGYICNQTCIKIDYVDIILQQSNNNNIFSSLRQIYFQFDQPINISQTNIQDFITLSSINNSFLFQIDSIIDNTIYTDTLSEINLLIQITLKQSIIQPILIVSLQNNITIFNKDNFPIQQRSQSIQLLDYKQLSETELSSSKSISKFNSFLIYLLIGFMALAFLLGGMDIFWNLLDTLQVLSYLKYLNVIFPYNLNQYFELFGFAEFDFLKSNISVEDILSSSISIQNAPLKFDEQGYTSIFYVNVIAVFVVLITTIGTYILFHIIFYFIYKYAKYISTNNHSILNYEQEPNVLKYLCYKFTRNLQDYFYRLKIEYQNGILRAFLTISYDLNLAIFLQLFAFPSNNNNVLLSSYFCSLFFFFFEIILIYLGIIIMSRGRFYFEIQEVKLKYGALFEGIILAKNPFSYFYNIILFVKKLLFMLILVSLYDYPIYQVSLISCLNCLFFTYLIYNKPLEEQAEQIKQVTTEILLWFSELLILLMLYGKESNTLSYQSIINLGWLIISILTLLILIQLFIDIRQQMIFLVENYRFVQIIVAKFQSLHEQFFNKNVIINHDESISLVDSSSRPKSRQKRNSKTSLNNNSQKKIRKLVTFKIGTNF